MKNIEEIKKEFIGKKIYWINNNSIYYYLDENTITDIVPCSFDKNKVVFIFDGGFSTLEPNFDKVTEVHCGPLLFEGFNLSQLVDSFKKYNESIEMKPLNSFLPKIVYNPHEMDWKKQRDNFQNKLVLYSTGKFSRTELSFY